MNEENTDQTNFESQRLENYNLATTGVGAAHSLRFRRPGGAVKSRVYIDEDL